MAAGARNEGFHLHLPVRPRVISHQSSSLPSTPRQHAREFEINSRTPSPAAGGGSTSPRSVSSDSRKDIPPLRLTSLCRFMSTQTSRRRIPYTIGTDRLEKEEGKVKATLDPNEEEKLSGDMRELYDRLLPSPNNQAKRLQVVDKLTKIFTDEWPGKKIEVSIFGSSGNLLCTSKSDVDVCVTMKELETTCVLAELLSKRGMQKVTCVHAKAVPIVKIWDPELQLACDLNLNNHVALVNTRLVKTYIQIDKRVRPLAMIVKYWTSRRAINEASGGTLSSYTWTLLLINFLQTRKPPVLPVLTLCDHKGQTRDDFSDDLELLRDFSKPNTETLGELFFQFFRRYGHEIDFDTAVVSVRKGKLLSKVDKGWQLATNNMLCVEEPFNTDRNLGNTVDDTAFRGLHLEFRQAFERIAEAKDIVSTVCEQFQFPTGETRPIFERPQPQPRPILLRSYSQSGRGGAASGSVRGNRSQRNGPNSRRASSAAAYGQTTHPLFQQSPQMMYPPTEFVLHNSHQQSQPHNRPVLQDQLSQHLSQKLTQLSQEEHRLRAQQMMLTQAQLQHTQALVSNQARAVGSALPGQQRATSLHGYRNSRLGGLEDPPATAPIYRTFPYGSQFDSPAPSSNSHSQQGTDTNPSSPLLTPPASLRRGFQRTPVAASTGATIRSHSQPPRSIAPQYLQSLYTRPQYSTMATSSHQNPPQEFAVTNGIQHQSYMVGPFVGPYGQQYYIPSTSVVEPIPREYLGYGFGGSPQFMPPYQDQGIAQTSLFHEDQIQSRPETPNASQLAFEPPSRLDLNASPSPLENHGAFTNGIQSDNIHQHAGSSMNDVLVIDRPFESATPLIVNGSSLNARPLDANAFHSIQRRRTIDSAGYPTTHLDITAQDFHNGEQSIIGSQDLIGLGLSHTEGRTGEETSIINGTEIDHKDMTSIPRISPAPIGKNRVSSAQGVAQIQQADTNGAAPSPVLFLEPSQRDRQLNGARNGIAPLDISRTAHDILRENIQPQSALLSPVRETPTPSPTSTRKVLEHKKEPYLNGTNGHIIKSSDISAREVHPQPIPAPASAALNESKQHLNGVVSHVEGASVAASSTRAASSSAAAAVVNTNPWQQATRKGKRGNKGSIGQTEGTEIRARGEPLPANVSERKGG